MRLLRAVLLATFFVYFTLPIFSQNTDSVLQPPAATSAVRSYHDGSIRDIEDIGRRNIGCSRGIGNWYSLEHQIAMGKQYSDQVEATSRLISDPQITEYVNRIGQNLVRNSDSMVPFTIKVIDSDDINAFALPGGFFYVDSGLILAADNEAELAGVMAHEIAHVAACHMARQNTRGKMMHMASIPLMMLGGPIGYAGYEALTLAMPFTYLKFSRRFESEADYLGVQYMYKAGYDPQALTSFFEKVKSLERSKQGAVAKAFRTHPQTPERIEKTQAEINTLLPPQNEYKVDTSEFEDAKLHLEKLENRGGLRIENANHHPTLRRREPDPGQN
ncbi:MAG TPA: M48 family metallopeptidase [Terriglobales bacterium]|nr:M48 family metallopeptidase [Terriglobales bacterium]